MKLGDKLRNNLNALRSVESPQNLDELVADFEMVRERIAKWCEAPLNALDNKLELSNKYHQNTKCLVEWLQDQGLTVLIMMDLTGRTLRICPNTYLGNINFNECYLKEVSISDW